MVKYERKLLKFWAQSFLLGVPKIIVGFRDQQGIVHRLEELETAAIPGKVKKLGRGTWDGNICINFAATFLECAYTFDFACPNYNSRRKKETGSKLTVAGLKTTIQEEGTWRIRKREKSSLIEVFKVEESGTGDIISPAFSAWRSKS